MSDSFRTSSFAEPTHTPQGDGKASSKSHTKRPLPNQLTPRKGTEKCYQQFFQSLIHEPTHTPQGDGKRTIHVTLHGSPPEPTHTPQGDGKIVLMGSWLLPNRTNSRPARGRKKLSVHLEEITVRTNSHPARGQKNRRNFSALHRCGRKVPSAFLIFCTVFQPGTAAEPFSECKTETPETKGKSL